MPQSKYHKSFSIIIIILNYSSILSCQTINDTNRLLKDKLTDYNKGTRPTLKQSSPTVVDFSLDLSYLQDFNEVQQTLKIVAYVVLRWTDELMTWNPADYGGIYSILTESGQFWTPNFILMNSAEKVKRIGDSWQNIRFSENGTAFYFTHEMLTSVCAADITYYPIDTHSCVLGFLPHGYLPSEMNITITRGEIGTSYYIGSDMWEIVDSRVTPIYSTYYSLVNVDLLLQRKPRYVTIHIIIPIIFLAFLNILSFLIPPESGERISYSITVLLAIAVFLTIVSDNLPKTSNPMSYFSYCLMTLLASSVCIIVCIIFNQRVYHRDESYAVKGIEASIANFLWCKRANKWNSNIRHNVRTSEQSCQTEPISQEERFYNIIRESPKPEENVDVSKRKTGQTEIGDFMFSQKRFDVDENATIDSLQQRSDLDKYVNWKDVSSTWDIIFFLFFCTVVIVVAAVFSIAIFTSESEISPSRLSVLAQNE